MLATGMETRVVEYTPDASKLISRITGYPSCRVQL